MGSSHVAGDALEALDHVFLCGLLERAHRAVDGCFVGDDVFHRAAFDLANGQHRAVQWIYAARDQGLQLADDGAGDRNRVQRLVGHGSVAALAAYADFKAHGRCHDGADTHGHLALRQRWPVVQGKHGIAGEALEQAVFHHGLGARTTFFRRLEDQVDGAVKVGVFCQQGGCSQQHGGVAVMAAGVHLAGYAAGVRSARGFLYGQGVHIGADADAAPGVVFGVALAVDGGHDACLAQTAVDGQAQRIQVGRNLVRRAVFFIAKLRVRMHVMAETEQFSQIWGDVVRGSHQLWWLVQLRAAVTDTRMKSLWGGLWKLSVRMECK